MTRQKKAIAANMYFQIVRVLRPQSSGSTTLRQRFAQIKPY